ncbi:MAG TPA: hypothetical protein VMX57_03235 [Planctomycetota bacterium]|nr:hypothetical protein [Planctomycetota bacterium]
MMREHGCRLLLAGVLGVTCGLVVFPTWVRGDEPAVDATVSADETTTGDVAAATSPPAPGMPTLGRVELYGSYTFSNMKLDFNSMTPLGFARVKSDVETSQARFGTRVFTEQMPLPILDMSYTWIDVDEDTTIFGPNGPVRMPADDGDHEFRLGAMVPIPKVGLFKVSAWDTSDVSAYGLYLVPRIYGTTLKVGYEWSEVSGGGDDDGLGFGVWTVPWNDWRFSIGYSDHSRGYKMGGAQAGRTLDRWFFAGGMYAVESDRPAWAVMAGRAADPSKGDLSFWAVHLNGPTYNRTNINIALGSPGIPREALTNDFADGIYTAMFTDQMGEVVPIPVRGFEEMRIWKRADEYAQPGPGARGGWSLYFDWIDAEVGYEIVESSLFYTHDRLGPLMLPHVGPVFERERLPGLGWQDSRFGIELGAYLGERKTDPFYRGGRFYLGVRGLSDFDDYFSVMGEVRINL